jgi:thioredoxin-like negative regulator of GroEL
MKPVVDGLVQKYAGKYDIKRMDLSDGDATATRLADSYGVEYVPTFVFLNADGSLANKIVGAVPVDQLEAELAKLQ